MSEEMVSGEMTSDALVSDALVSGALVSGALVSDALVSDALVSDALVSDALVSGEPAKLGRRDRRKLEARRRLLAAAREVLAEQGEANLRIADLTERADIGFGTFYSHFESKEAIVEAVLSEVLYGAAAAIGGRALKFDDPAETAAFSYRRFLRFAHDEPELAAVLVNLAGAGELFEQSLMPYARKTLERGRDSGRFQLGDLELCLISITAAAFAAIKGVLDGRVSADSDSAGAEMMLRGFGVNPADAHRIAHQQLEELELSPRDLAEPPLGGAATRQSRR